MVKKINELLAIISLDWTTSNVPHINFFGRGLIHMWPQNQMGPLEPTNVCSYRIGKNK